VAAAVMRPVNRKGKRLSAIGATTGNTGLAGTVTVCVAAR